MIISQDKYHSKNLQNLREFFSEKQYLYDERIFYEKISLQENSRWYN